MAARKIARDNSESKAAAPETWDIPATVARTRKLFAEQDEIRERDLPDLARRARLLAADLAYAADMLEKDLGAPDVRRSLGEWVNKIHLLTVNKATLDGQRWLTLIRLVRGAASDVQSPPERYTPSRTATDHVHEQLRAHAAYDRDFVARVDVASVVALLPLWSSRKKSGGRGARPKLWPAIRDVGVRAGLREVDEETVRAIWKSAMKDVPEFRHDPPVK